MALADNKKLVQDFFDTVINQHDVSAFNDFVAVSDGPTCGGVAFTQLVLDPDSDARLVPKSPSDSASDSAEMDAWRDFTEHVLQAFPDMKVNIESMVAEGDEVAVSWTGTGTQRGEFLGTAATGRAVPFTSIDIFTVKDGKIASLESQPNTAAVLDALGQLPDTPLAKAFGDRGK